MSATFGNVVMLGLPLTLSHFGEAGMVPVSFIVSVHAPNPVARRDASFRNGAPGPRAVHHAHLLSSSVANSPATRSCSLCSWARLWRATGFGLHPVLDRTLELLAGAGIPAALVALGLSLAGYSLKGQWSGIATLIVLKMILLPVVIWLFAAKSSACRRSGSRSRC